MLLSYHLCEIGLFGIFRSETEREMRSPLLQKMRQEFDYGDIDFLPGFVRHFYNERKQEFPFGYYFSNSTLFCIEFIFRNMNRNKGGMGMLPMWTILGSQRPNLITFISPLAFDPLTKSTLLVLCAWLLHSRTTTPYSYNGCSTL
jgi:hypothetical protein